MLIYDADGNEIGSVPLTEKQQAALDAGGTITVLYHTPQLLQGQLGTRSGQFSLQQEGDRLLCSTPTAVKDYEQLRVAVRALKTQGAS